MSVLPHEIAQIIEDTFVMLGGSDCGCRMGVVCVLEEKNIGINSGTIENLYTSKIYERFGVRLL